MITRDELIETIEKLMGSELLAQSRLKDIYANGVQVMGSEKVNKIALGVTASVDFMNEAVGAGAEFCLFHHGMDLSAHNIVASRLHKGIQSELATAITNNLTIAGYHHSLDFQPDFGNNATIIKLLGATMTGETYFDDWGYTAQFDQEIAAEELASKLSEIMEHDIFSIYAGPKMIKKIGVCSGGAKPYDRTLWELMDKHVDAHIAGEIIEASVNQAREVGYNYFACGHYATEVFGVQELGKKVKEIYKDKLEVEFIDIPNPL